MSVDSLLHCLNPQAGTPESITPSPSPRLGEKTEAVNSSTLTTVIQVNFALEPISTATGKETPWADAAQTCTLEPVTP